VGVAVGVGTGVFVGVAVLVAVLVGSGVGASFFSPPLQAIPMTSRTDPTANTARESERASFKRMLQGGGLVCVSP
jgi:hypothetical protein